MGAFWSMNDFIALKDGTLINLHVVAYIHPTPGPALPDMVRGVEIVFPSIALDEELGTESSLTVTLRGSQADEFVGELRKRDIDVSFLDEARKDFGKTLSGRIARELSATRTDRGLSGSQKKGGGLPGPKKQD